MQKAERFGPRLRELRLMRRWTQKELADKAGVTMGTLSRFERGELVPIWPKAVQLADALGVSLDEFTRKPKDISKRGRGRPGSKQSGGRQRT